MATQTLEFPYTSGQTIASVKLYAENSDTEVATSAATEEANRKGIYLAAYIDVPAGVYRFVVTIGTTPVYTDHVELTLTTATFLGVNDKAYPQIDADVAAIKAKTDQMVFSVSNQIDANALTIVDHSGTGNQLEVFTITEDDNVTPINNVECWISTDAAGTDIIAGVKTTDGNGKVSFMLDVGVYYFWKQKNRVNFVNPESITVT